MFHKFGFGCSNALNVELVVERRASEGRETRLAKSRSYSVLILVAYAFSSVVVAV